MKVFNSKFDESEFIRIECEKLLHEGVATWDEHLFIWNNLKSYIYNRHPFYVEILRDFFDRKEVQYPKFFYKYNREVTEKRINGDDSKPEKVIKNQYKKTAFSIIGFLLAVGATKREAYHYATMLTLHTFRGRIKKPIKVSTLDKEYTQSSGIKEMELIISKTLLANPEQNSQWLDCLNRCRQLDSLTTDKTDTKNTILGNRR